MTKRKLSITQNYPFSAVLTDIEGTTTPLSFVKDILFPYILDNIKEFLDLNWDDAQVIGAVEALRVQSRKDESDKIDGAIIIPDQNNAKEELIECIVENVKWQMSSDRKIGSLKTFQGLMWKNAYESGLIKGTVYPDVVDSLKKWNADGIKVSIYSSGSIAAQKLLFGHSDHEDLLPVKHFLIQYFYKHFDTGIGSKLDCQSYIKIAKELGLEPHSILFLSDNVLELNAARQAGYQVRLIIRPGNQALNQNELEKWTILYTFSAIDGPVKDKKSKIE